MEKFDLISHGSIILSVLIGASIITYLLRKALNVYINKVYKDLKGQTNVNFIKNSVSFTVYSIGLIIIFTSIPPFEKFGTTLFAGAGVLAAIVGFASQKAFSNIISGVFIIIFRPFRVGDTIEPSSGKKGVVEEITLRHIVIRDYEFRRVIIPNSTISDDVIVNSTILNEYIRKHVVIGISYDSDLKKAIKIFKEVCEAHPSSIDNRTEKEKKAGEDKVTIIVEGLNNSSVDLRAYVWAEDNDKAFFMMTEIFKETKLRFDQEGIEIPFPHRTVVFKNKPNL